MIRIDIANEQSLLAIDEPRLREGISRVLAGEDIHHASISLAILDDAAIRPLNAQYLGHDYATDVLSFVLERSADRLEGEIIASAGTAIRSAARFGWQPADELLLYVIHGALHLVGYDDLTPEKQARMRDREREHLAHFGLVPRYVEE
jgi:probable rRNA maturation factor